MNSREKISKASLSHCEEKRNHRKNKWLCRGAVILKDLPEFPAATRIRPSDLYNGGESHESLMPRCDKLEARMRYKSDESRAYTALLFFAKKTNRCRVCVCVSISVLLAYNIFVAKSIVADTFLRKIFSFGELFYIRFRELFLIFESRFTAQVFTRGNIKHTRVFEIDEKPYTTHTVEKEVGKAEFYIYTARKLYRRMFIEEESLIEYLWTFKGI